MLKEVLKVKTKRYFTWQIEIKKGIVILVNKWDKIEKETSTSLEFEKKIKAKILPFDDVPILFVSALTKNRLIKSIEVALSVF